MKKYKVALLAFTNPLTKNRDGGKIEILTRIDALNILNSEIDLFTNKKEEEVLNESLRLKVKNIFMESWTNKIKYIFNILPISVNNRYFKAKEPKEYDYAIYENLNMHKFRIEKDIKAKKHFLRVHNIESEYRFELFKSNMFSIKNWLQLLEAFKYKLIEKTSLEKYDKMLFISNYEKNRFENKYPKYKDKFIWMPPVVENYVEEVKFSKSKDTILAYGDFTVSHNREGIIWYLKKVYKELCLKNKDLTLEIIGKISEEDKLCIESLNLNLKVLGYVEDLESQIEKAAYIIAPILTGAGVKIKVLHALSRGKILITTPKGVEGTTFKHSEHLLIAKNEEEFINISNDLTNNYEKYNRLPKNSIEEIKKRYTVVSQAELLGKII